MCIVHPLLYHTPLIYHTPTIPQWSIEQNIYRLCASMSNPHGNYRVTDIAVSGGGHATIACVSSSIDGTVKMWHGVSASIAKGSNADLTSNKSGTSTSTSTTLTWSCVYSFKYRECPATCLEFSIDRTLLAVTYEKDLQHWIR